MPFAVLLHTTGPVPGPDALCRWLTEQGEPFNRDGDVLNLRALPVRLEASDDVDLHASIEVTPDLPLVRLVDMLFELSVVSGADVVLEGKGTVTRATLWVALADEQDRQRIALAVSRAEEFGNLDKVLRKLWALLNALGDGQDIRWSAKHRCICEMREVGAPGGLTLEDAAQIGEPAELGDLIPVRIHGYQHILAWRWLSEAYPSLTEG